MGAKKVRLNLELPVPVKERLEQVRLDTNAGSISEVIRRSLAVYFMLVDGRQKKAKLVMIEEDGTRRELLVV